MWSPNKKKNGFTLLELTLVLAGIAVVSTGGFILYQHTNTQSQTSLTVNNSRLISNIVMQSYGQTGSFANLSSSALINGRVGFISFHFPLSHFQVRNSCSKKAR